MASPTGCGGNREADMIDTHEDGKTELRLAFNKNVERLEDIDRPDICNDYPESAHDIIAAYLKYTTFTAKVWVNYDTSWKKFFVDKRIEDCGRLVMGPQDEKYIQELKAKHYLQLSRIRFEVGTAFNTLCHIGIRAVVPKADGDMEVIVHFMPQTGSDPELINHLRDFCRRLHKGVLGRGRVGFTLLDIESIASQMLRKPDDADFTIKGFLRHDSDWMDLRREGQSFTSTWPWLR